MQNIQMNGFKRCRAAVLRLVVGNQIQAGERNIAVVVNGQHHIIIDAGGNQCFGQQVAHHPDPRYQVEGKPVRRHFSIAVRQQVISCFAITQDQIARGAAGGRFYCSDGVGFGNRIGNIVIPHSPNPEEPVFPVVCFSRGLHPVNAWPSIQRCLENLRGGHLNAKVCNLVAEFVAIPLTE